jgi:hypothetical protein
MEGPEARATPTKFGADYRQAPKRRKQPAHNRLFLGARFATGEQPINEAAGDAGSEEKGK